MNAQVRWQVCDSAGLGEAERSALRALWAAAFDDFTDDDADHAYGGVHVVAWDGAEAVAHASAVPRRLRVGETWQDAAYVEGVAVTPLRQRSGAGTAAMRLLHTEIEARWSFAMLSTGQATTFYERLGWQRWGGVSSTVGADGSEWLDDEHGGLMVLRLASGVDPALPVACEDRAGDA